MTDIGLYSGELLVVDKAEKIQHGNIVIAEIEDESFFHADALFHGTDDDSSHQDLAFCAHQQAVLTNHGIQIIHQGVQSGFRDFHGSAVVPCGGCGRSRFSCTRPEIHSQGFATPVGHAQMNVAS